jgi:hypothetical protein
MDTNSHEVVHLPTKDIILGGTFSECQQYVESVCNGFQDYEIRELPAPTPIGREVELLKNDINWRCNKNELPDIAHKDAFDIRSVPLLVSIDRWGARTGEYLCHKGQSVGLWQISGVHGDFPDNEHTVYFAYINKPA